MRKSTGSITLVLVGSALFLAGCGEQGGYAPSGQTSGTATVGQTTGTRTRHAHPYYHRPWYRFGRGPRPSDTVAGTGGGTGHVGVADGGAASTAAGHTGSGGTVAAGAAAAASARHSGSSSVRRGGFGSFGRSAVS